MSLPAITKTWQYNVNASLGGSGNPQLDNAALFIAMKNALKGFATLPWVVMGSSNGSTGAMDGTDRISTQSDMVISTAGSPHTWIVLRQAGIHSGFSVLFSFGTTSGYADTRDCRIAISPSVGFSGGSSTTDPTASDALWMDGSSNPVGGSNSATDCVWTRYSTTVGQPYRLHVMQSTDGQCTRVITMCNNQVANMLLFDVPRNPVSSGVNWTIPFIASIVCDTSVSDVATYPNLFYDQTSGGRPFFISRGGASPSHMEGNLTCEGFGQTNTQLGVKQTFINDLSQSWPIMPIGYVVYQTTGRRGRHCTFYDLWCGTTNNINSSYPATGTGLYAQFGVIIVPWNGSVPLFA